MTDGADFETPPNGNERLDELYRMREDLKTVADSDVHYAKYAQAALTNLREAGYDV